MFKLLLLFLHMGMSSSSDDAYLLQTERLPSDLSFMPAMGNGHLGFSVYGDAIYMNGLYNGRGGDSRRARIPNWLNVSVAQKSIDELGLLPPIYELDLRAGIFRWRQTTLSGDVILLQRIYAHRYYTRALVFDLTLRRFSTEAPLTFHLTLNVDNESSAMNFTQLTPDASGFSVLQGVTRVREHDRFQKKNRQIFIVFSDPLRESDKVLSMMTGQKELNYRYLITIDEDRSVAQSEMQSVLQCSPANLIARHTAEWQTFWDDFSIHITGNVELTQTVNAGIFYLASSLPSTNTNQPIGAYYGLSPTGLARGQLDADYEGHNFWDTEIWMLPAVTQLSIEWARLLLQYRYNHLPGAQYNAQLTGYKGARFPWESAYTGTEVTNPCCPEVAAQEVHISADIAIALRQHYAASNDRNWLCATAWPLSTEIADFLASRVEWNNETQKFHVYMVMGPDEDHWNVSDSVYTNAAFKQSLMFACFTQKICTSEVVSNKSQNWLNIVQKLSIPYDTNLDYHPEFSGYKRGTQVKQADVILLGFPLQYPMNVSTRSNDLHYYAQVTRPSGPAMTHSMLAINFLDTGETAQAAQHFQLGYKEYVRPEFKVWSETKRGFAGSANFLTGVGGFMQAILAGYAGLRFHHDDITSIMEIRSTRRLPPGTTAMNIDGIKFAGAKFSLTLEELNVAHLSCSEIGKITLTFAQNGEKRQEIYKGFTTTLSVEATAYIRTA